MTIRLPIMMLALLLGLAGPARAYPAHEGDYLFWAEMPEAARVAEDMKQGDAVETAARRHAAGFLLQRIVEISADGRKKLPWPARERQLNADYFKLMGDAVGQDKAVRSAVFAGSVALRADPAFLQALLKRYFSPRAQQELQPFVGKWPALAQQTQRIEQQQARNEAATRARWDAEQRDAAQRWRADHPIWAWLLPRYWLLTGASLLASVLAMAAMLRRHGISAKDPWLLHDGSRRYRLQRVVGRVMAAERVDKSSTTTSGGTGGVVVGNVVHADPVRVHTTHWQEQRIFLRDDSGHEYDIQLVDAGVGLRPGHRLSAMKAVTMDEQWCWWLAFRNHDTRLLSWHDRGLVRVLHVVNWASAPLMLLGALIGLLLGRRQLDDAWLWALGGAALGLVVGIGFAGVLNQIAASRFKRQAAGLLA